jgi:hypothetical protein
VPAFKLGGMWRFSRSIIDEWIARLHGTNLRITRSGNRKSVNRPGPHGQRRVSNCDFEGEPNRRNSALT